MAGMVKACIDFVMLDPAFACLVRHGMEPGARARNGLHCRSFAVLMWLTWWKVLQPPRGFVYTANMLIFLGIVCHTQAEPEWSGKRRKQAIVDCIYNLLHLHEWFCHNLFRRSVLGLCMFSDHSRQESEQGISSKYIWKVFCTFLHWHFVLACLCMQSAVPIQCLQGRVALVICTAVNWLIYHFFVYYLLLCICDTFCCLNCYIK